MKGTFVRFFPVLILILVACNFVNAGTATAPTPIATSTLIIVPSPEMTLAPIPGDLGFGNVTGKVTDAVTGLPIPNATVTCEHYSYTSKESDRCNRTTTTDQDGVFLFEKVFLHDTDNIKLTVDAPGYQPTEVKQAGFTMPGWKVDVSLNYPP
jgi:carboxypeptidase family protein